MEGSIDVRDVEEIIRPMRDALAAEVRESQRLVKAVIHMDTNVLRLEASSEDISSLRAWFSSYLRLLKVSHEVSVLASKRS